MWFSYDGNSFELHDDPQKAKDAADRALGYCTDEAVEGWPEETTSICWGRVVQKAEIVSERPRTGADAVDSCIDLIQEIEMVGGCEYRCNICGGLVVFDGTKPAIRSMR